MLRLCVEGFSVNISDGGDCAYLWAESYQPILLFFASLPAWLCGNFVRSLTFGQVLAHDQEGLLNN